VRHVITFLATGAYVGYLPIAPGTFGSLLAVPLLWGLGRARPAPLTLATALVLFAALAMVICQRAGAEYADPDSGTIVLDEVCGMLVAGAWIVPTALSLALVFLLFRVFDVWKPFPARWIDRHLRNGVGVVGDDLVAGLYANLLVRVLT